MELTKREREIVQLIVDGLTSQEIADKLGIAYKTVDCHRAHIAEKLGTHGPAELVTHAIRAGLVDIGDRREREIGRRLLEAGRKQPECIRAAAARTPSRELAELLESAIAAEVA